ncbi:MAG: HAMP domain-containing histidine kinase [Euryarchaeota archaeon]|nr:HAMP domain-containing histidine kinase [Euryarchaeota archaeon]
MASRISFFRPGRPSGPGIRAATRTAIAITLLLILIVPSSEAAVRDIQIVESNVDITLPLDVERFEEHNVRDPADQSEPVVEGAPREVSDCGAEHITTPVAGSFRFVEDSMETGCAEARFHLKVPAGAKSLEVRFGANRIVDPAAPDQVDQRAAARQHLRIYNDTTTGPAATSAFFADNAPNAADRVEIAPISFPVGAEDTEVWLAWYFADLGRKADTAVPGVPTGDTFQADVYAPVVVWRGVPLPLAGPTERSENVQGTEIETRFRVATLIRVPAFVNGSDRAPYLLEDARFDFRLRVADQNELLYILAPDGGRIVPEALSIRREAGLLEVQVPSDVSVRHGEGLYTFVYSTIAPIQGSESLKPLVVLLLFLPLPAGVMAWLAARRFEGRVGRAFSTTTLMLKAGVLVASVYYVIVLFLSLRSERLALLSTWPLPAEGGLLYGLLLLALVAFVALWLFGDRYLAAAMRRDIEEQQRMARELKERSGELESFVYAVSHDLKTPLVSLEWLVHSLEESLDDKQTKKQRQESLERILGRIHANIDGMDTLISDLLELSRVGRVEGAAHPVDLGALVQKVVDDYEAQCKENGARIEVEKTTLPTIMADRTRMEQVLRNLVGNAIKYGRMKDGHIRIRARLDEQSHGDDRLLVEVEDNGPGVPEEFREQIFMLFQRAPDPYGRPIQGTGVGLALARKIARSYGGDLFVSPSEMGGARFVLALPARRVVTDPDILSEPSPRPKSGRTSGTTSPGPSGRARPA